MPANELTLLLGPDAAGVVGAAIGQHDAALCDLRLTDIRVAPNGAVRARYAADVRLADGTHTREALVAATGNTIPDGAAVVAGEYGGLPVEVGVWRWPQDPALPALRVAENPASVAALLTAHGLPVAANPQLAVRAYRPAQRAVLEVRDGHNRYFLKVVRPGAAQDICIRHQLLCPQLPVPPVLAHSPDGIVVLAEAPGSLVREALVADGEHIGLPAPADLESLLDALPAELLELAPHRTILQRVHDSAEVLRICATSDPAVPAVVATELVSTAARIVERLSSAPAEPSQPIVPVHGDFYHAQLLAQGSRITALLDVDTAGPGERADDWATMIGYLSVAGLRHAPAREYSAAVFAHAERRTDRRELCRRTAAVVLALATGPFRHQQTDWPTETADRLALAQRWLAG